jgi:ketosteroid isomerase-like protein
MSENEELPIIQVLNLYCQTIYDKNLEAYLGLYAEDAKVFDMWGPEWLHASSEDWRTSAKEWFKSLKQEKVEVEFEEIQVEQTFQMGFLSAFVKYSAVSPKGKVLRSLENRFTCIVEPRGGAWKITHQHTSGPINPSDLKGVLNRETSLIS